MIDGLELHKKFVSSWMKKVGYVPQSPYIFDGSLAQNVAFGLKDSEIDRKLVSDCCDMANMQDFMDDLTHGIDSLIGERGVRLSGGQQQRVAIARAMINNPKVILADEPTGNLDEETSEVINNILKKINKENNQTIIVVTHSSELAAVCDKRYYLRKGRLEEEGERP